MRALTALALAGSLGACAAALPQQPAREPANSQMTKASANVGKILWVAPEDPLGVEVCEEPTGGLRGGGDGGKCEFVKKGRFTIQAVENERARSGGNARQPAGMAYRVAFDDGRIGYMGDADLSGRTTAKDPAIATAECKQRGNPRVGMTADQVIATCWGKPEHINHTQTGTQTFDQYVYSNNRNLYFQDGVLRSFQGGGQPAR
jgi:hypothetical protein